MKKLQRLFPRRLAVVAIHRNRSPPTPDHLQSCPAVHVGPVNKRRKTASKWTKAQRQQTTESRSVRGRADDAMQAGICALVGVNIPPLVHHDSASTWLADGLLILQNSAQAASFVGARVHDICNRRGAEAPPPCYLHGPEQRPRSPRSLSSEKAAAAQPPGLLVPELANIPRVVRKQVNYLQPDHLPK